MRRWNPCEFTTFPLLFRCAPVEHSCTLQRTRIELTATGATLPGLAYCRSYLHVSSLHAAIRGSRCHQLGKTMQTQTSFSHWQRRPDAESSADNGFTNRPGQFVAHGQCERRIGVVHANALSYTGFNIQVPAPCNSLHATTSTK